jgi:hypothetical protein
MDSFDGFVFACDDIEIVLEIMEVVSNGETFMGQIRDYSKDLENGSYYN